MSLNDDQHAVLLRELHELVSYSHQLHTWVKDGTLNDEMRPTLLSLIESQFVQVASLLDYESHLTKEKADRHSEIRAANEKIRELKAKLSESKPTDGLKEQLTHLVKAVKTWWRTEGFVHTSEASFSEHGTLSIEFRFMLAHYRSRYSDTPVSDKRTKEEQINHFRQQGYRFADFEEGISEKLHLIDCEENRVRLTNLLRDRFPSLSIQSWLNESSYSRDGVYVIDGIRARIHELGDI